MFEDVINVCVYCWQDIQIFNVCGCFFEFCVCFGIVDDQSMFLVQVFDLFCQSSGFVFCGCVFDYNQFVCFCFCVQCVFEVQFVEFFWQVVVVGMDNRIFIDVIIVEDWCVMVIVVCVVGVFLVIDFFGGVRGFGVGFYFVSVGLCVVMLLMDYLVQDVCVRFQIEQVFREFNGIGFVVVQFDYIKFYVLLFFVGVFLVGVLVVVDFIVVGNGMFLGSFFLMVFLMVIQLFLESGMVFLMNMRLWLVLVLIILRFCVVM